VRFSKCHLKIITTCYFHNFVRVQKTCEAVWVNALQRYRLDGIASSGGMIHEWWTGNCLDYNDIDIRIRGLEEASQTFVSIAFAPPQTITECLLIASAECYRCAPNSSRTCEPALIFLYFGRKTRASAWYRLHLLNVRHITFIKKCICLYSKCLGL
jgi:hypothetical protein